MVSRTSLKHTSASSAGAPVNALRSHLESSFRSVQQSAAHLDAGAPAQSMDPSTHEGPAPHARVPSHVVEHLPSGNLALPQHGRTPATTYVLRTSSDPVYTSEWRDEQPPPATGGTNLHRNASPFTLIPSAGVQRNRLYLFPASATSSLHSSSGSVPMLHAPSSARGPQSMAAPNQAPLLFRSALSTPPVPAAPAFSLPGLPSAALPASLTPPTVKDVDVAQLANRVYELLVRRLSSERQRRGM